MEAGRSGVQDQSHLLQNCRPAWTKWCCSVWVFAFLGRSQAVYITLYFLQDFSLNHTDCSLGDLKAFHPFLWTNLTSTASQPACFSLDALVLNKAHPHPELTLLPEAVFVRAVQMLHFSLPERAVCLIQDRNLCQDPGSSQSKDVYQCHLEVPAFLASL